MFKQNMVALAGTIVLGLVSAGSAEAFTLYSERSTFESQLGTSVLDDYSAPGYFAGDKFDQDITDIHTNANMSSIVGETQYTSTGIDNLNIISLQVQNPYYCAGCSGSFLLDFTSTSVGTSDGVFGVGFDFENSGSDFYYTAFVTFGNGSSKNIDLSPNLLNQRQFFGITSDLLISSIHFGLPDGGNVLAGNFELDNLTIGSSANPTDVPEPASTFAFLAVGAVAAGGALKKKQAA